MSKQTLRGWEEYPRKVKDYVTKELLDVNREVELIRAMSKQTLYEVRNGTLGKVNNYNTKELLDVNRELELILFVLIQEAGKRSSEAGRGS